MLLCVIVVNLLLKCLLIMQFALNCILTSTFAVHLYLFLILYILIIYATYVILRQIKSHDLYIYQNYNFVVSISDLNILNMYTT